MNKSKYINRILLGLGICFTVNFTAFAEIPTEANVQQKLKLAKSAEQNDAESKAVVQHFEETLVFLEKIKKQKADSKALQQKIETATGVMVQTQQHLEAMKKQSTPKEELSALSLNQLQEKLVLQQQRQQQLQQEISALNTELVALRTAPDRAQATLTNNLSRSQAINSQLSDNKTSEVEKAKLNTELEWLNLQNTHNQMLLQGGNGLTALYTLQLEDKNLEQSALLEKLQQLQDAINQKYLQESQQQAELLTKTQQENNQNLSPLITQQLDTNVRLSRELVAETAQMNNLSQDNLRIKNVLDNLQQTQRNIDDQISALQGTLVLSRIINKQKNLLPQDKMISGLSKRITDLRVRIFDFTEARDGLYDVQSYVNQIEHRENVALSKEERAQLTNLLQERRKLLSDIVNLLNNQLNLAINVELNQKQVAAISDQLQGKLQQQSFWVRSNAPIDFDWITNFVPAFQQQAKEVIQAIDFSNWRSDLLQTILLIACCLGLTFFIQSQKQRIKHQLSHINTRLNSLKNDSQWNTPKALVLTALLSLQSTLLFLVALIFITYVLFEDPMTVSGWGIRMATYWWFFSFMLALLRPNGIAYRHFNMPKRSVDLFREVLSRSVWIIALWVNAPMLTYLDSGITNDVIGQVVTIFVLIISWLIVGPRVQSAVKSYKDSASEKLKLSYFFFNMARVFLIVAPLILIVLVVMGYYYTALNLMDHLMSSYFVFVVWLVLRNMVYRSLAVSAQRLSYQRLLEKREQQKAEKTEIDEELGVELKQDESLGIAQVRDQILRVTDLVLNVTLLAMMYWVWKDLVTVAYYLQEVTLWQQSVTTEAGTIMESITLLNLLLAIVILLVMYALVRNIGGLLEVLVFSRMSFSQGTPYTITTLSTYFIIAIGAGMAFSTLGMSWAKLQWLFAALSVGLGFGLQAIFANFVSGIIILFERPVRVGDVVTIGEFSGTVSKIRIRSTTLIDFDRKEVIIPNQSFVTDRLVNWALNDSVTRVVIQIGVAYGSDLELTKRLLLQAATECERVLKDPEPVVFFLSFGASTLDHELRLYVGKLSDRNPTIDLVNRRIDELFAQHNIEIAFNQMDVFIKNVNSEQEIKVGSEKFRLPQ